MRTGVLGAPTGVSRALPSKGPPAGGVGSYPRGVPGLRQRGLLQLPGLRTTRALECPSWLPSPHLPHRWLGPSRRPATGRQFGWQSRFSQRDRVGGDIPPKTVSVGPRLARGPSRCHADRLPGLRRLLSAGLTALQTPDSPFGCTASAVVTQKHTFTHSIFHSLAYRCEAKLTMVFGPVTEHGRSPYTTRPFPP